jgi:hypothetical protein
MRRSGTGIRISGDVQVFNGPFGPGKTTVDTVKVAAPNGNPRMFAYKGPVVVAVLTLDK